MGRRKQSGQREGEAESKEERRKRKGSAEKIGMIRRERKHTERKGLR